MAHPVVHFEVIGTDPAALRAFYGELFGWEFDTSGSIAPSISDPGEYGFVPAAGGAGIPGGVGGGPAYRPHVIFYVGVPDVEAALRKAAELGGKRVLGPQRAPGRDLAVGHFHDPQGNLVGVAGPADPGA
jgi:predicted enzyme related to lactoylglutathione lyase